ncbi:hypothetical protein ACFWEO_36560 [Streptomyces roseolus]|uniref:hypothetical protein n=1 Tax=Streptomyces roseolus TaxID=67358 RepID=UPI003636AD39
MEKYGELFAEVIVPQLTAGAVAQECPVVVFVAGQAGSGKTRKKLSGKPPCPRRHSGGDKAAGVLSGGRPTCRLFTGAR